MKKKPNGKPNVPWEVTDSMFLSEQETEELLNFLIEAEQNAQTTEKHRAVVDRLIVEILIYSGLRNSELCHLKIGDTEAGHQQPVLNVAETSKETRCVYLPRRLSQEIVRYVEGPRRELAHEGQDPKDNSQPLILNERGRPYDRTALYRRVVRILTAAGLGDRASVQLLRHTYGYLAYKRSRGNLLFVQQQMGHAHPMVTAVYSQFVKFSYSELADNVAEPVSNPDPSHSQKTARLPLTRKKKT